MDQPLRYATIRKILAIAACSVLLGCGVLIASVDPTAAFPVCRGSGIARVCVNVDPTINNPSFIHFRLVSKDMNVVYNIRDGNRQWEEKGKAQNGLHYVARVPNATVSVQGCKPGVFGSNCGPWYKVPLIVTSGRGDPASDHSFSGTKRSDFCAGYARAAVEQVKRASLGACGYAGARWTSAIGEHTQWCLRQNHASAPKAEEAARDVGLRNCKAPAVSTPLFR